ncbi:MAG: intein-containing recombinase RecA, partial [Actinomycetota bacterium]
VAEAQRNGGICAYIDAEHALDVVYARALGVNVDELLVSQPDTGEQALEIADMLIRSGAVDVIIVDSVAALVPRAEIEGEMGDTHVGLQARLMSQALRKLAGNVSRSNAMIIFINQLREKIGVMFGCFAAATEVTLADGSSEEIGKIVKGKLPVEVLSYDPQAGAVVPKRVVNWFDNGPTKGFMRFKMAGYGYGKPAQFACTPNHQIRTPGGWREAQELSVGDRVMQAVKVHFSDFHWEAALGMLMGNARLTMGGDHYAAALEWEGSDDDDGFWKLGLFPGLGAVIHGDREPVSFSLPYLPELVDLGKAVHIDGNKVFSYDFLKRLTPLSWAVWYADAAVPGRGGEVCIPVDGMEAATRARVAGCLADTWGIKSSLLQRGSEASLVFAPEEAAKLQELVASGVHPSMEYKLSPQFQGRYDVSSIPVRPRRELMPFPIVAIHHEPPTGDGHRYDIEVEGSHTYFVDGVMVHNSPETTPGGRALKFYASVRLDIRKIENIKNGQEVTGSRVRVKVVKSKVSAPFRQAEFDIQYGHGISKEGSLLDTAAERGIVVKSGSWYLFNGDQIGQGRENAKAFLSEHPDVCDEIAARVKQAVGLGPAPEVQEEPDASPVFTAVR